MAKSTDYGHPDWKKPLLHGRKFNPNPKFFATAEAYFVYHIDQIFQISLIYAFIGCPYSVAKRVQPRPIERRLVSVFHKTEMKIWAGQTFLAAHTALPN